MISENDKQAILGGTYGVSRGGVKVKFIGMTNNTDYPYQFIYYAEDTDLIKDSLVTTNNFLSVIDDMSTTDIVGLWGDKLEPFNLERALNGEPVKLRCGLKAYIKYVMPPEYKGSYPLIGYIMNPDIACDVESSSWIRDGKALLTVSEHENDIIGMWKEKEVIPVLTTVTVTLPRALRNPRDEMWYVDSVGPSQSTYGEEIPSDVFEGTPYFRSRDDANAWFQAMQDSRK